MVDAYGEVTLVLGANDQPVLKGTPDDEKAFRRYVGLLDGGREIGLILVQPCTW